MDLLPEKKEIKEWFKRPEEGKKRKKENVESVES